MLKKQEIAMLRNSSKVREYRPNDQGQLMFVGLLPKSGIKHNPDELAPEVKIDKNHIPKHLRHLLKK